MTRVYRFLTRLFRRRRYEVSTYSVRKTDYRKSVNDKCRQLAEELGRAWPKEG